MRDNLGNSLLYSNIVNIYLGFITVLQNCRVLFAGSDVFSVEASANTTPEMGQCDKGPKQRSVMFYNSGWMANKSDPPECGNFRV